MHYAKYWGFFTRNAVHATEQWRPNRLYRFRRKERSVAKAQHGARNLWRSHRRGREISRCARNDEHFFAAKEKSRRSHERTKHSGCSEAEDFSCSFL